MKPIREGNPPSRPPAYTAGAFAFLFLLTLLYFWPFLAGGKAIYESDTPLVGYPTRYFAAWAVHNGLFPGWNPSYYLGYPFLAEGQAGVFYPLNILFYLAPLSRFTWLFHALLAAHYWMAGCFAYLWLRRILRSEGLALWGGMTFEFSGFMISHVFHVNLVNVCAYLPLTLYLYDLARERKRIGYWLGLSLVGVVQILAGHFLALTLCWTGLLGYALGLAFLDIFTTNRVGPSLKPLGGLIFSLCAACLIGAPQLWPSALLGRETGRVLLPQENEGFMTLEFMRVLWNPNALGHLYFEKGGFIGLIPLMAVAALFVLAWLKWKRVILHPLFILFVALAFVSLWFTMGPYSTVYREIAKLPPYSLLRYPSRYLLLFDVFLIAAAGLALKRLLTPDEGAGTPRPAGAAARRPGAWRSLLLPALFVLQIADLSRMGVPYTVPTAAAYYDRTPDRVAYFLSHLQPGERVLSAGFDFIPFNPQTAKTGVIEKRYSDFLWEESGRPAPSEIVPFYAATRYRIPTMGFYEQSTLIRRRFDVFMRRFQTHRNQEIINLLGAGYVMIPADKPFLNESGSHYTLAHEDEHVKIFRNQDPHPKAFLVSRYEISRPEITGHYYSPGGGKVLYRTMFKDANILDKLFSYSFDSVRSVILEEEPAELKNLPLVPAANPGEIQLLGDPRDTPGRIELNVRAASRAILVLSESYDPNWKATVDGKPAAIYPANYVFQALVLSAGEHRVEFRYDLAPIRTGLWLFAAGVFLLIGAVFISRRAR